MIAIFAWILESVSFAEAWNAARDADLLRFSAAIAAAVTWWFLLESRALAYLFTHLNTPVSWAEARSLRALTYLVTPINWNLGTAAIVLHLRQSKNISALASSSTLLFYAVIDGLVMAMLFASSIWLLPQNPGFATAANWVIAFMSVQVGILALVMTDAGSAAWLEKLRAVKFLQSWRRVRLRNILTLFSIRAAYFSGFVFLYWWGAAAFGVNVPLEFAMAAMPIIQGSAALPVTPGGLGTQQAVMLEFYEPFGPESAILAFGVAFPVAVTMGRMAIGLLYVRDLAEFRRVRAEAQRDEAQRDEGSES
jgi:uncharacterized membrane protein YbhN (UPF0104 family)